MNAAAIALIWQTVSWLERVSEEGVDVAVLLAIAEHVIYGLSQQWLRTMRRALATRRPSLSCALTPRGPASTDGLPWREPNANGSRAAR